MVFFILNEVCVHICVCFFYRIRYVMQKNIVIFLILHIFIWRLYWCWIHMRSFRKAFTSCAFLNYVCVQKNAFFGWWLNGKKKKVCRLHPTSDPNSWTVFYPLVEPVLFFYLLFKYLSIEVSLFLSSWVYSLCPGIRVTLSGGVSKPNLLVGEIIYLMAVTTT